MSGFFGAVLGQIETFATSEHGQAATGLLSSALASSGGISGLFSKFQSAGLGGTMASWIGTGSNLPISVSDIEKVFPPDQIEAFAEQHGVPPGIAKQLLAQFLPHAVDAATPNGTVPAPAEDPTASGQPG